MRKMLLWLLCLVAAALQGQKQVGPVPTRAQLRWHQMEYYLFVHFGPNTFTDKEWGHGDEPADVFNPTGLDCRQWCRIAKAAGAAGIIITAKHHDGFCLWPSKYSTHTVKQSKWKNGQGDVLKELSQACKEYGLKFGVYISPWDRNHPQYGTPEYNNVFVNMMKEIFTNYGPIWELWWDGANGEGPNGKRQVYDWTLFKQTVKRLSPSTLVFSDVGPHIRWIGNEKGFAGETNWNLLDTAGFSPGAGAPPLDTLNQGNANGKHWIPGECDVSIRPGWFYHASENDKVKTPRELLDIYLKSVGRGANLLLNVPPGPNGRIHPNDSTALMGLKEYLNKLGPLKRLHTDYDMSLVSASKRMTRFTFHNNYHDAHLTYNLSESPLINCVIVSEAIDLGQRVKKFSIELISPDGSKEVITGTTIGHKRILTFPERRVRHVVLRVRDAKGPPVINWMRVRYLAPAKGGLPLF